MRRLDHLWRTAATGAAFAFIFVGGGLLAGVMLPLLPLPGSGSHVRVRRVIHRVFRFYLLCLRRLGLLTLRFENTAPLDTPGGRLIVANHPSLLDVVMLMALIPDAQCIVKSQLWTHPLLGPLMRRAGYIRNDLEPEALLEACRNALRLGQSLIIFPEGTRSQPGQPPRFRRGFANLATLTAAPIQTVLITCDPPTLIKGEPWWKIPPIRPTFRLTLGERLEAARYLDQRNRSVAARRLVQSLERYYAEKLGYV
ncbi:2-acyl-glycerophospho-ethanolamine acyltransferase [mine drainage metagenome]|uniref:2-acyl-glycerophospho-ethanolamine acyltransferase n=1 Tax=mine drainage metagenome TaxID=410659 RepID=A0A1J5T8H4_9ZZZZ